MYLFRKFLPKILWLLAAVLIGFFGHRLFFSKQQEYEITENSQLIQQQILNVGKLVVTEGTEFKISTPVPEGSIKSRETKSGFSRLIASTPD